VRAQQHIGPLDVTARGELAGLIPQMRDHLVERPVDGQHEDLVLGVEMPVEVGLGDSGALSDVA
jgi:hypothetical protein